MSNEITVRITCSLQEMYNILQNKGFKIIDKYNLEDTYYIKEDIDIKKQPIKEIFNKYILIRNITQFRPDNFVDSYNILKMTLKIKNIESDGTITNQCKKDCQIYDMGQGKAFLTDLGYKNIMTIKEKAIVYEKDGLKLAIKEIENGDNLIEIETEKDNPELNSIDKLKEKISELQIPVDTNDYFIKKAEIELKKFL
mgnify:FL=1